MQFKNRKTHFSYIRNTKLFPTEVAQNTPTIIHIVFSEYKELTSDDDDDDDDDDQEKKKERVRLIKLFLIPFFLNLLGSLINQGKPYGRLVTKVVSRDQSRISHTD